ncbi:MAG TPA: hypothetical protein VGC81_08335 [Candidatus Methylomirabilis sp.]
MGGTDAELAEALDVGSLMGGTLAAKSVRHAFEVLAEIREAKGRTGGGKRKTLGVKRNAYP